MTEVVGHLLLQRGLQHSRGHRLQQPVRAGDVLTRARAARTNSATAARSAAVALEERPFFGSFGFEPTPEILSAITGPTFPADPSARRARNTVQRTVPSRTPYRSGREPGALQSAVYGFGRAFVEPWNSSAKTSIPVVWMRYSPTATVLCSPRPG